MGLPLELPITLTAIDCGECDGTYAINEKYRHQRQTKGGGWHCPYCQVSWGYFGKTQLQKTQEALAEERSRKEAALSRANQAEQNLAQALRSKARLEKRIKAGVCPCCTRSFKQLAAHMARKHPDYKG